MQKLMVSGLACNVAKPLVSMDRAVTLGSMLRPILMGFATLAKFASMSTGLKIVLEIT